MALTLRAVIDAARNQSPFFHKSRGTPDKLLGDELSTYQNELIGKAVLRDKQFLSQTATIVLNAGAGDLAATAGAGSITGLPGTVVNNAPVPIVAPAGRLVQVGVTAADGATVIVAKRVVSSATSTSVTSSGAARSVNGDADRLLVIVQGAGAGQYRRIVSNTADTWVTSTGADGRTWTVLPDDSSMMAVVAPVYDADGAAMVLDAIPPLEDRPAYLVRLSSAGVPFIDYVAPLVASVDVGLELPAAAEVTGGKVFCVDPDDGSAPLTITTIGQRFNPPDWPAVYINGGQLFLCGDAGDWEGIASLALEYVPVAPAFTAPTDYFLVPDTAKTALVAFAAELLMRRTLGQPGTPFKMADVQSADAKVERAELTFLARLGIGRRARISVIQPG